MARRVVILTNATAEAKAPNQYEFNEIRVEVRVIYPHGSRTTEILPAIEQAVEAAKATLYERTPW